MGGGRGDKKPKRVANNGKVKGVATKAEMDNGKTKGHA